LRGPGVSRVYQDPPHHLRRHGEELPSFPPFDWQIFANRICAVGTRACSCLWLCPKSLARICPIRLRAAHEHTLPPIDRVFAATAFWRPAFFFRRVTKRSAGGR
jgi:hypothetical protein